MSGVKFCVIGGHSTFATRIKTYFNEKIEKIRIMTNDIFSYKDILTKKNISDYNDVGIDIIVDKNANLDNPWIKYLKKQPGITITPIPNVKTNLFLKENASSITLELYPFGFDFIAEYSDIPTDELILDLAKGFSIKLYTKNNKPDLIRDKLIMWFDESKQLKKLVELDKIDICSTKEAALVSSEKSGNEYKSTHYALKTSIVKQNYGKKYNFQDIVDKASKVKNFKTETYCSIDDEKVSLGYSSEKDNNLIIEFYDNLIIKLYDDLIYSMKNYINKEKKDNDLSYYFELENITSDMLYGFIKRYFHNKDCIDKFKSYYIKIMKDEYKFNTAYKKVYVENKIIDEYLSKGKEKFMLEHPEFSEYDIKKIEFYLNL